MNGAGGADVLYGGSGNDTFTFSSLSDSINSSQDIIMDFTSGDKIKVVGLGFAHVSDFDVIKLGSTTLFDDPDSTFSFQILGNVDLTDSDFIFS